MVSCFVGKYDLEKRHHHQLAKALLQTPPTLFFGGVDDVLGHGLRRGHGYLGYDLLGHDCDHLLRPNHQVAVVVLQHLLEVAAEFDEAGQMRVGPHQLEWPDLEEQLAQHQLDDQDEHRRRHPTLLHRLEQKPTSLRRNLRLLSHRTTLGRFERQRFPSPNLPFQNGILTPKYLDQSLDVGQRYSE